MLPNWEQLKTQLMLPQLASAAIETAIAQLLRRTENHQPQLRKLSGKVLAIHLNQPEINCYFIFSQRQIDVLHQFEGTVDCEVHTSAKTLLKMPKKSELTEYLNDQSIILHGDLQVLQDFLGLMDFLQKILPSCCHRIWAMCWRITGLVYYSKAWLFLKNSSKSAVSIGANV